MPSLLLLSRDGRSVEREFPLDEGEVTIGRGRENVVVLLDEDVSRYHARVRASSRGYVIEDLGSANGVRVQGHRVAEHVLVSGDVIRVGSHELEFAEQDAATVFATSPEDVAAAATPRRARALPAPAQRARRNDAPRLWLWVVALMLLSAMGSAVAVTAYVWRAAWLPMLGLAASPANGTSADQPAPPAASPSTQPPSTSPTPGRVPQSTSSGTQQAPGPRQRSTPPLAGTRPGRPSTHEGLGAERPEPDAPPGRPSTRQDDRPAPARSSRTAASAAGRAALQLQSDAATLLQADDGYLPDLRLDVERSMCIPGFHPSAPPIQVGADGVFVADCALNRDDANDKAASTGRLSGRIDLPSGEVSFSGACAQVHEFTITAGGSLLRTSSATQYRSVARETQRDGRGRPTTVRGALRYDFQLTTPRGQVRRYSADVPFEMTFRYE